MSSSDLSSKADFVESDIYSIVFYREHATSQQDVISRFYEIIENAVPLNSEQQPVFSAGATPYHFKIFTSKDPIQYSSYSINSNVLIEELPDGIFKYYLLDEKNGDYEFLIESCME